MVLENPHMDLWASESATLQSKSPSAFLSLSPTLVSTGAPNNIAGGTLSGSLAYHCLPGEGVGSSQPRACDVPCRPVPVAGPPAEGPPGEE